jgi:7-carboxy-7-deazaguanine synthase
VIVNEIFYSIQGESTRAGAPCVFVRLTGCNLRCVYCDTAYAFTGGAEMRLGEIESAVAKHPCSFVTITGGEPLLQPEVHPLMSRLADRRYDVQIETGGSLDISRVDPRVRVILDVKTPGSGMMEKFDWENLARLRPGDEVKFVVMGREDYDWAVRVLKMRPLPASVPVLMSPAHGTLDPRHLAEWMTRDAPPARLHLQIHKYIWGPDRRGV